MIKHKDLICEKIKKAQSVLILPHIFMDGDTIGSALALGMAIKKINTSKYVCICIEEPVPDTCSFLSGMELICDNPGECEKAFDIAIAIDVAELGRLGKRMELFCNQKMKVNIDHHGTNTSFADINAVSPEYSATGEIIFQIIKRFGADIDKAIAECLYTAIVTDTGGFRFENTTPETHLAAAELMGYGIDAADISYRVFDAVSLTKVLLTGKVIETLEFHHDGKLAIMTVNEDMIKATGANDEDCEGLVNIGRNIIGVEISALLKQMEGVRIKINLRSKSYVDVSGIASVFSGGGHKRAAGYTAEGMMTDVKRRLIAIAGEHLISGRI